MAGTSSWFRVDGLPDMRRRAPDPLRTLLALLSVYPVVVIGGEPCVVLGTVNGPGAPWGQVIRPVAWFFPTLALQGIEEAQAEAEGCGPAQLFAGVAG